MWFVFSTASTYAKGSGRRRKLALAVKEVRGYCQADAVIGLVGWQCGIWWAVAVKSAAADV